MSTYHKHKLICLWLLIVFSMLGLTACNSTKSYAVFDPEPARKAKIDQLSWQLGKLGVQVVQIGETIRIIIPSDKLFNVDSANPNFPYANHVLDTVSTLMLIVETTSAKVEGYTNCEPSARLNKALSERQAQTVIDYLWGKGVDARLLYAVGYGAREPLAAAPAAWINRRIEINFQYMPLAEGGRTWPVNIPSPSAAP